MDVIINFFQYFAQNISIVGAQLGEHIFLTIISLIFALIIGIPLGISVFYFRHSSKLILGVANVIQAIPSIALLGFLIPLLGIGSLPAIVGVTLYSLLPIIKNTYLGVSGVRPEMMEAAKGMGLTKAQRLMKIQLPIALPVIMGGIRIAAVTAVGMITIAALIGGGGLGTSIFAGIRTVNNSMVLLGAIPACLLALFVDFLFGRLEDGLSYQSKRKKKNKNRKAGKIVAAIIAIIVIVIIIFNVSKPKYDIAIGARDFSENVILGEMTAQLVENETDLTVDRKLDLSGFKVTYTALEEGQLDIIIDYTGTVFMSLMNRESNSNADYVYQQVAEYLAERGVIAGPSIGFNNTYTLSTTKEIAKEYNLKTISDLEKYPGKLSLAATIEFVNRVDGLPGLEKTYDLKFSKVLPIDSVQRFTALTSGKADIIDAFSTDGLIKKYDLVTLEDNKHYFPPYYAFPLFSAKTLEKYPELNKVMNMFKDLITDEEMQEMNYLVDEVQESPAKVAHDFLVQKGIVK